MRTTLGVARILWGALRARLSGRHRHNPFFDAATSLPVSEPPVLTRPERAEAAAR